MSKITATAKKFTSQEEYPRLMISEQTGCIYIMSSKNAGTCIQGFRLGEHNPNWVTAYLIPYKGVVVVASD